LPLANLAEARSPQLDWIGESAAETLRESLHAVGLMTLSREDREEVYRRLSVRTGPVVTKATVIRIGETLDAGEVVFGDFKVDGSETGSATLDSNIRLSVRVIDLRKLQETALFEQSGPLRNLSLMETKLAWFLLRMMVPGHEMAISETIFQQAHPPIKVDALESYARGLSTVNIEQRTKLFTQAARIDERFTEPAFQLGRMAVTRRDFRGGAMWLAKVVKTDSHFMEASFLLGICRYNLGDFDEAAKQFRMVVAEIPLNEVFNNLGAALSRRNNHAAALENFSKALEGDPADPDFWFNVGYSLWKQGRFDEAAAKFRGVLDRASNDQEATTFLGRCLKGEAPRNGDPRTDGRERIKTTFEDSAFLQLQAEMKGKKEH